MNKPKSGIGVKPFIEARDKDGNLIGMAGEPPPVPFPASEPIIVSGVLPQQETETKTKKD